MTENLSDEALSEICFLDESWIRVFGLSAHNALDYFACSPFYDHKCNNELVRMQKLDPKVLVTMKGLEYSLLPTGHEPVLFVVVKQHRASEKRVSRLALYYILDKTIYQAPTLQRLIVSRLVKSSIHLQNAFDILKQAARYTPSDGFTWHFEGEEYKEWRKSAEGMAYEARRKRRDEQLERSGQAEISSILNTLVNDFLPPEEKLQF